MLELLEFALFGVVLGTLSGLVPGLHVNSIAALFLSLSLDYAPLSLAAFFFSMAIAHTFVGFIPSILLGVPSEETALGILPGHALVLKGRGEEAIKLTLVGGFGCLLLGIALIPLFYFAIPLVYSYLTAVMGWLLLFVSVLLCVRERNRFHALFCLFLSGLLGVIVLRSPAFSEPLLPLLTGLFGLSMILHSIKNEPRIPPQISTRIEIEQTSAVRGIVGGTIAGALVGFLPGFGPSQAAVLTQGAKERDGKEFLITLGGIGSANTLFALVALYTIGKTRSGIVAAISELIVDFELRHLLSLMAVAVLAGGLAFLAGLRIARVFPNFLRRFDYRKTSFAVAVFMVGLVALLSGFYGLLVLLVSASIGVLPRFLRVSQMHLMGVLIVPTALWFLGV